MVHDVVPYANKGPRTIDLYLWDLRRSREEIPSQFCSLRQVGGGAPPELLRRGNSSCHVSDPIGELQVSEQSNPGAYAARLARLGMGWSQSARQLLLLHVLLQDFGRSPSGYWSHLAASQRALHSSRRSSWQVGHCYTFQ